MALQFWPWFRLLEARGKGQKAAERFYDQFLLSFGRWSARPPPRLFRDIGAASAARSRVLKEQSVLLAPDRNWKMPHRVLPRLPPNGL
jgi:hypothetical protein